ncbi:tail fiber domain-containing protein [Serratia symbiotica]|uniref:tail fiber domain-containing protein n=1 Tax=Serratia symbiotica TaxID=138074 RepID=UPI001CEFCEA6|nr:tail fiber domain-containing protein [Serratia symbiotica]
MSAGTLTLTNNSVVVIGEETRFITDLKAGDMVVSVVGGVTYTLPISTVESDTQATLIKVYDGPTQTGAAYSAVPREAMNYITAQLVAETTKALRGMNYDKWNWQKFFTVDDDITITLPDNSQSTGPSARKIINSVANKVDKAELEVKADKIDVDKKADKSEVDKKAERAELDKKADKFDIGTTAGTVAAGDDPRIVNAFSNKGGVLKGMLRIDNRTNEPNGNMSNNSVYLAADPNYNVSHGYYLVSDQYHAYRIIQGGNVFTFKANGQAYAVTWNNTSDIRLKPVREVISNALDKVNAISGYTYIKDGTRSTGLIAQEVEKVLPEVVTTMGDYQLKSDIGALKKGSILKDTKAIAYGEVSGLLVQAIKELTEIVKAQGKEIGSLKSMRRE